MFLSSQKSLYAALLVRLWYVIFDHVRGLVGHTAVKSFVRVPEEFASLRVRCVIGDAAGGKSLGVDPDHVAVHAGQHHWIVGGYGIQFLPGGVGRVRPHLIVPAHAAYQPCAGGQLLYRLPHGL